MLHGAEVAAFVATVDQEKAEAFYSGVLGLELIEKRPVQLVYQCGPTKMRVVTAPSVDPHL